jgi:MBG domain (YGX type)/Putative Ig domain
MTKRLGSAAGSFGAIATSALHALARAPGRAALVVVLGLGASALATLAPAASASADSTPQPFTCLTPTDFLLNDTTLYSVAEPATGLPTSSTSYTKLATSLPTGINALGFDPLDGLLYAVAPQSDGEHLLEIDSTGTVTDLGVVISGLTAVMTSGGFDPSGNFWVTEGNGSTEAWSIDVSAATPTATGHSLSGVPWDPIDWTYADGYFWGYDNTHLWRFDPTTDDAQTFELASSGTATAYNGAWTFANGDLGFYATSGGDLTRVTVTNPASDPPDLAVDTTGSGAPSGGTDGDAASCAQVAITTPALAGGQAGEAYSATLAATGGPTPADYSWALTAGALPAGLSLDPSSGIISGTPTTGGVISAFMVQVTAGGAFPVTATQSYTIPVGLVITTTSLPDGTYGTPYSATLSSLQGDPPYSWSVIDGSLPPGLSLDPSTGSISGTPTAAGSSTFTVQVADSSTPQQTTTQRLTLTVGPAPLTANVGVAEIYGGSPSFVVTSYSGLLNGDTGAALSGTLTGCVYAGSGGVIASGLPEPAGGIGGSSSAPAPGTYPGFIDGCSGLSSPNYTITYSGGNLVVTPAPLTITASSASMAYGSTPPIITPSYSGFVNGDTAASLTTQPTCGTTATAASPAGTYPSSCAGAIDPDYAISYVPGTVTVGQTLTITASSGSSSYGSAPPTITPSYSGFVDGDTAASLTTQPTCGTTATASSPVGSYPSTCAGAVDPAYTIGYVAGTVTVNPAPLTITAASTSMTYGSTPPTITPSYSGFVNGDTPASLTAAPTCTTTATSSSGPGSYPTTCSGAADGNYAISYVAGTVTVTPARLSISASSGSMTYGSTPPDITPSYSGFVNGETASSLTTQPTCTTTATGSSPAGTYASSCTGAVDANYLITYVNGTVTVGPAALTIIASSTSMTYGSTPPTISPSYTGFVNGDTAASLATAPSCGTTATSASPVGTYSSSCAGAVDTNYTISYVPGSVAVTPAHLIITASSASSTYGSAPSAITPSYSGFVNGDTASSLTTQPTCTTTASASSPVGTYTSSCSGAADGNYAISYDNGTVTVTPAALAITASSDASTYGSAPPAITPSYSGFVNGDSASSLTTQPTCTTTATGSSPAGTYGSSCSGAVDANYLITYVNGTVTVGPAALTIIASSTSMTYGSTPPTITPSYSGFVNGDTASSLTTQPTCTTTATSASRVGSYTSSCTGAVDPNYTISYVNGTATVGPAALTIIASSTSMTYGSTPPTINPSYSGFVNGDTATSLTTQPTCTTTASVSSPVGSYTSSCTGAVDPNYTISYVPGSVTVGPASTTLAYTGPASISAGTALVPAASLTSSASACQTGQAVSFSLSANPTTGASGSYSLGSATTTSSGAATAASVSTSGWEAGAYMITASYAGTANCDAANVTAPLVVSEAGDVAVGAGTYSVSGVGPVAFGFVVWRVPLTSVYLGGISVVGGGWSLTGQVTGYSLTSGTQGVLTGTGILSWWNPALNHGHGGWQVASTSVSYTATFTVTSKTSPGSFGVQINYTPVAPQPVTLPDSAPMTLKSGLIVT